MHEFHDDLPGFDPSQIWHDGCAAEVAHRGVDDSQHALALMLAFGALAEGHHTPPTATVCDESATDRTNKPQRANAPATSPLNPPIPTRAMRAPRARTRGGVWGGASQQPCGHGISNFFNNL